MFPEHPQEAVVRALSSANNNLDRAVEVMLNTPSPRDNASSSRT